MQAAESLCMNGRALNEKAIEVSPSSSRVLDRAAEILTPFPPSKNRPRPGDWTCPSCGFSNFQRRTACFRCSFPAMSAAPPADPMYPFPYGHPSMMPQHHAPHGHGMGHMRGGNGGGVVPFRAGDWKCGSDGCGYHNFAKNVSCLRCGASRAGAAVVPDPAYPPPMDGSSGFGMGPPPNLGGAAQGAGPFGAGAGFGSGPGFPGQQFGGPPSTYALPSGLGAANPYQQMGAPQYGPGAGAGMHAGAGGGFDGRGGLADGSFSSVHHPSVTGAGIGFSNGASGAGGFSDGPPDPFSFLSSGLGSLSMNDDGRRGVPNNAGKSPA